MTLSQALLKGSSGMEDMEKEEAIFPASEAPPTQVAVTAVEEGQHGWGQQPRQRQWQQRQAQVPPQAACS